MLKFILISSLVFFLYACTEWEPKPFEPSSGHIQDEPLPASEKIPELVQAAPILPVPEPPVESEKYTVVVNEVPVKELLFALARDAQVNVDIDPSVEGVVTINAVDQTLPQILNRVARQVDLRYEFESDNLIVQPDKPHFKTYKINYLNIARDTSSSNTTNTQIVSTSSGEGAGEDSSSSAGTGNNSVTEVTSVSENQFWKTLTSNILAILGEQPASTATDTVIPNPEAGLLVVKANTKQHEMIQNYIDLILYRANRQVMIQATIIEVELSDQYQAGINWAFLNAGAGLSLLSDTAAFATPLALPTAVASQFILDYFDKEVAGEDTLQVTVRLLSEFGNVKVLSSPQLMVLNNQTALLKVVNNIVYFTVDAETSQSQTNTLTTFETNIHTVPVGVVMAITPQINDSNSIILNVRPTISRVNSFVNDPNPSLTVESPVPQIQVREMESVLRMNDSQIAVLGGLMQDESRFDLNEVPGASKLPGVGRAFETRTKEYAKSELVIFLRPLVVNNPSLDADLQPYRKFFNALPATDMPVSRLNNEE